VRDGKIARAEARDELSRLLPAIRDYYYRRGGADFDRSEWVFPLAGYTVQAIGNGQRHGYEPRGYDWFDGNRHKGHPAVDIFIRDRGHDERDERTGQPVPVLSLTGGIVVALETAWEPGSELRGGKYLWIYDPATDTLVYYAHNRELAVGLGTIVKPGDRIATVGRTGFNAYKKRSPTHLHLTLLRVGRGTLVPEDPYPILRHCRTR
jgi:murein DD-endopeptidase MepM/ murein hydrolase activator NlpD